MQYKDYLREKFKHTEKIAEAEGYPCILEKSKSKPLKDYRIYGNSIQDGTPTPETPIEIESVGEKTLNLFNLNNVVLNGSTLNEDGTIYSDKAQDIDLYIKAGKYSISIKSDINATFFIRYGQVSNGYMIAISKGQVGRFEFAEDNYMRISTFDMPVTIQEVMLVSGNYSADSMPQYEPYGYKIPVEVGGKNLFDMNILSDFGFVLQEDGSYRGDSYILGTRTLWTNTKRTKGSLYINGVLRSEDGVDGYSIRTLYTDGTSMWGMGITNANKIVDYVQLAYARQKQVYLSDFMIAFSDKELDYETYIQPATTNIYLDEPLRKLSDYADYIDFKEQKVVRYIIEKNLNDVIGVVNSAVNYANGLCRMQDGVSTLTSGVNWGVTPLCSGLKCFSGDVSVHANNFSFVSQYRNWYLYLKSSDVGLESVTTNTNNAENATAIKEYLADKNLMLYYALTTPIETPINLPQILTAKGNVQITIDTIIPPSNIWCKYIK